MHKGLPAVITHGNDQLRKIWIADGHGSLLLYRSNESECGYLYKIDLLELVSVFTVCNNVAGVEMASHAELEIEGYLP
jgi:hypothetical protein